MTASNEALTQLSDGLAEAVDQGGRSTVLVRGRRRIPASGVAWGEGVIVTADHVLERDEDITVGLPDGSEVAATVAGRDPGSDLAVLRVEADLTVAERAEDGATQVGHLVLALGRPTPAGIQASLGAVSAIGGPWRTFRGARVEGYLRPDVTFYPGFSGGPLIDVAGRVVGVNSSHLRRHAGLTVPAAAVSVIASSLIEHGRIRRGYLGVASQPAHVPETLAAQLDGQQTGLLITGVEPESPAGAGGVLLGDLLVGLDDTRIEDHADLHGALGTESVGRETRLRLVRGGELRELTVTVGERAAR